MAARDAASPFGPEGELECARWLDRVEATLVDGLLLVVLGSEAFVPVGSPLALLWYLWPLWERERRAPHDLLLRTHVLRD